MEDITCKYKIRTFKATDWNMLTQEVHFEDYYIHSEQSLGDFARELAREGFSAGDGLTWIMPASILTVEIAT